MPCYSVVGVGRWGRFFGSNECVYEKNIYKGLNTIETHDFSEYLRASMRRGEKKRFVNLWKIA
jgi:hypothetical protein